MKDKSAFEESVFNKSNVIIDDYGHHPTEIKATISAIKQEFYDKNIIIVYHPDRPKRLVTFVKMTVITVEFAKVIRGVKGIA